MKVKTKRWMPLLETGLAAAFWIGIWALASFILKRELLLPSPLQTLTRLISLAGTLSFWNAVAFSLLRILIGFLLGLGIGCTAALLSYYLHFADVLVSPFMTVIRATPVASFIILALVWLRSGSVPSFVAILMVVPIVWKNVLTGLRSAPKEMEEVCTVFRLSPFIRFRLLLLPSAMPYFFSSVITSIGLAWKAGIAAEVLCTPKNSIGKQLYESKLYLETQDLFAFTLTVILCSLLIEKIVTVCMRRWQKR